MSDTPTATGSCLCGAVSYRVDGPLRQVVTCHCRECRKQTTHFMAFTGAWKDQLAVQGEEALRWYRSGAHSRRGFCATCGSFLFFDVDGRETISIGAGSLDRHPELRLQQHMWLAEKGAYYTVDDDARHDAGGGIDVPMPPKQG